MVKELRRASAAYANVYKRLVSDGKQQMPRKGICVSDALDQLDEESCNNHVSIYAGLLRNCGNARALSDGKRVHEHIVRSGHGRNGFLGDLLVQMYGKCGTVEVARAVFDKLPTRSVISWNLMIGAYARNEHGKDAVELYHRMGYEGAEPDVFTYASVLGACSNIGDPTEGRSIHARIAAGKLKAEVSLQNALVNMYGKCGSVADAKKVFDGIEQRDVISWTAIIAAYANNGRERDALDLYQQLDSEGVQPDCITFATVIGACSNLAEGKAIHARVKSNQLDSDVLVGTALVNMYAKCGSLDVAKRVFERIKQKNVVSWTAMITAYAQKGHCREALDLYGIMESEGLQPDGVTFVSVLGACATLGALEEGKAIHARITAFGFQSLVIDTALVTMYSKCGRLDIARSIFDQIKQRKNVFCWTAMISAYAQLGYGREALDLYAEMVAGGVEPNEYTFSNVLAACCCLADLEEGKRIDARIKRSPLASNIAVQNALVNMYAKCGSLELARLAFDAIHNKNVVTWNGMIAAYAQHGHGREALDLYERMTHSDGLPPDEVTFASSLSACAILGALQEGKEIHTRIVADKLQSSSMVQAALVNMYGRCGSLDTARSMFDKMEPRDVFCWSAMTAAYAQQGHASEVLDLHQQMELEGIQPNDVTFTSILIGCSHAGLLDEGVTCFLRMQSEHGIAPIREHYLCMVDILGRAGRLEDAESLINSMPFQPDSVAWMTLLSSCRTHTDGDRGKRAARHVLELDPHNTSLYSLLSNIYTAAGRQADAFNVQRTMKEKGLKKPPGCSIVEL